MHYQIYFFLAVTADEFKIVTKHDDKNCGRYLIRGKSMRTFVTITLKLCRFRCISDTYLQCVFLLCINHKCTVIFLFLIIGALFLVPIWLIADVGKRAVIISLKYDKILSVRVVTHLWFNGQWSWESSKSVSYLTKIYWILRGDWCCICPFLRATFYISVPGWLVPIHDYVAILQISWVDVIAWFKTW